MTDTDQTAPAAVTALSAGTAGVVLSIEFLGSADGPGPGTALAELSGDIAVWRADPVFSVPRSGVAFGTLVAAFAIRAAELLPANRRLTIVGHCTAARLAELIAAALVREHHAEITCVLVGPFYPDDTTLNEEFVELRRQLGRTDRLDSRPEDVAGMVAVLQTDLQRHTAELGLDADEAALVADQLLGRYRAWLSLLAGLAGATQPSANPRETHVIAGDDGVSGTSALVTTTRFPGRSRQDLPADPEVAELILRLARE